MYTARHFNSVAAMLLEFRDKFADSIEGAQHYGWLVRRFTDTFRFSNKEFDKEVFEATCGWTEFIETRYQRMIEAERGR